MSIFKQSLKSPTPLLLLTCNLVGDQGQGLPEHRPPESPRGLTFTGKAHFRHALALLNLGHAVEARASCERGRGLFPEEEALLALGEKIDVVLASATTQPSQQRMVEQWLDDQAEADTGAQDLPRRSSLEMQYPPLLPL